MAIEAALDRFINSANPSALALHGTWGRGKTTLWNNRIELAGKSKERIDRQYAYLSLFGLNSIAEVRTALWLSADSVAGPSASPASEGRLRKIGAWVQGKTSKVTKRAMTMSTAADAELPYLGSVGGLARALANHSLKNMLICLDDLERRGNDLRIRDVLGLVSELVVSRKCSVILIFNDAVLGEEEAEWVANREKVFQSELHFEPDARTCVSLILPEEDEESRELHEALVDLNITNLRIVQRAHSYWKDVRSEVQRELDGVTRRKVARSLALLTFAHLGAGEGAPPLRSVLGFGSVAYHLRLQRDDVPPEELELGRRLESYAIALDHDLDTELAHLVERGHVDPVRLRKAIDDFEGVGEAQQARAALESAWQAWHSTFDDNLEEVVRAFEQSFTVLAEHESARQLDAVASFLRSLGAVEVADRMIEAWLSFRVGDRLRELLPEELNEWEAIRDPVLVRRAAEKLSSSPAPLPPLLDAFNKLATRAGHNREDVEALAVIDDATLAEFLRGSPGRLLPHGIKAVLALKEPLINPVAASAAISLYAGVPKFGAFLA